MLLADLIPRPPRNFCAYHNKKQAEISACFFELLRHFLAELSSAEYVKMQMLYALAGIAAAVSDNSVTVRKVCICGDFGNYREYL